MKKYLKLLRVKHYIKNFLVFIPLFFSGNFTDKSKILSVLIGMIGFCFISSAVYIINDIKDVEKDRMHPVKKTRPIASNEISIKKAVIIAILCIIIAFLLVINIKYISEDIDIYVPLIYLGIYLVLNVLYSFNLKNVPIVDIVILASGFLIRILFGGKVANVEVSSWLYLTVIAVSFYLGLGKRRNEIIKHSSDNTRQVLKYYTKQFLDKNMYVCMALAITFYALWAMNHEKRFMIWTVPIIMIISMKYSLNIECSDSEGDPVDVMLKDKFIILLAFVYFISVLLALYVF